MGRPRKVAKEEVSNVNVVKMTTGVVEEKQPKEIQKLSYEDLHKVATQAVEQARYFQAELQKANYEGVKTRLDFLFKVIQYDYAFPEGFVKDAANEIMNIIVVNNEVETKEE